MSLEELQNEVTALDVIRGWRRFWLPILLFTGFVTGVTVVVVLKLAPIWRAKSSIIMSIPDVTSRLGAIPALAATQATPLKQLKGILESERALISISDKTGLSRKTLREELRVIDDPSSNQIKLEFTSKSQEEAKQVLNVAFTTLKSLERDLTISVASAQAEVLSDSIKKKKVEVTQAEQELLQATKNSPIPISTQETKLAGDIFQEQTQKELQFKRTSKELDAALEQVGNLAKTDISIPTSLPPSKNWREKYEKTKYELGVARISGGPENPRVKFLERELGEVEKAYRSEVQSYLASVAKNADPKILELSTKKALLKFELDYLRSITEKLPAQAIQISRLQQEVATRTQILAGLRSQYEQSKIESEVAKVKWTQLEEPYIEEKPINKRYALFGAVAFLLSFLLASLVSTAKATRHKL